MGGSNWVACRKSSLVDTERSTAIASGISRSIYTHMNTPDPAVPCPQQPDWYFENGLLVYTEAYHLKRGSCCGSGCRHCPYEPKHVEGNTQVHL